MQHIKKIEIKALGLLSEVKAASFLQLTQSLTLEYSLT